MKNNVTTPLNTIRVYHRNDRRSIIVELMAVTIAVSALFCGALVAFL
jgi:hypothetical protein